MEDYPIDMRVTAPGWVDSQDIHEVPVAFLASHGPIRGAHLGILTGGHSTVIEPPRFIYSWVVWLNFFMMLIKKLEKLDENFWNALIQCMVDYVDYMQSETIINTACNNFELKQEDLKRPFRGPLFATRAPPRLRHIAASVVSNAIPMPIKSNCHQENLILYKYIFTFFSSMTCRFTALLVLRYFLIRTHSSMLYDPNPCVYDSIMDDIAQRQIPARNQDELDFLILEDDDDSGMESGSELEDWDD
jgi:hypothetical protein